MSPRFCIVLLLLASYAWSCRAPRSSSPTPLAALRAEAERAPGDMEVQRRLLAAEFFGRGGEAKRVQRQLTRLAALAPSDPQMLLVRALHGAMRGDAVGARDDLLHALAQLEKTAQLAKTEHPHLPAQAEAIVAALVDLREVVPHFIEKVRPKLERWAESDAIWGVPASAAMRDLLLSLAQQRGDTAQVERWLAVQGCVHAYQVAGPFGPHPMLSFDRLLPPEKDSTLRGTYDLGLGRGQQPIRQRLADGCEVNVAGAGALDEPGVYVMQASLPAKATGVHVLRVVSNDTLSLQVDGRHVATFDRRSAALPRVQWLLLHLTAGQHVLRIKLASRQRAPRLSVALRPGSEAGLRPPQDADAWTAYLATALAIGRGDLVGARQLLARHAPLSDGAASMLLLRSLVALYDPLLGTEQRRDQARQSVRAAARRDAQVWYPALQLGRLEAAEGRLSTAVERLRQAVRRWPAVVSLHLSLAEVLRLRGWDAEEGRAIAAARALVPDACAPLHAALSMAENQRRAADADELAKAAVLCDARSQARLSWSLRQRRWPVVQEELQRLAKSSRSEELQRLLAYAALEAGRGHGDAAAVDAALVALRAMQPRDAAWPLAQADGQWAAGNVEQAQSILTQALQARPDTMGRLGRALWTLGGNFELAAFRLDGRQVIRDFEHAERQYDAPQVMVLDSTVVRVFDDGSSLELTHNVFKVQSQEAVQSLGEYRMPEGAQMITLRTLKADGGVYEPEAIADKDTLSLPNLQVGDYVEIEYLRASASPAGFPVGFLGDRFYFRNFDVPLDRSELTYLLPKDAKPVIEPRGAAPALERQQRGELSLLRWRSLGNQAATREPLSVDPREYLPSVQLGVRADWSMLLDGVVDLLADRVPYDPQAAELARRLVASQGTLTTLAQARRLHRWVMNRIDNDSDAFGLAPAMLAAHRGNRARVLHYLYRLLGFDAHLLLARSATSDARPSRLADEQTYEHLLVGLRVEGKMHVVSTLQRWAPFEHLPLALRGQPALRVAPGMQTLRLPTLPAEHDRQRIELSVELRADGSADVAVRETLRGEAAVAWRQQLQDIAPAVLRSRFAESYVGALYPGADLRQMRIDDAKQPDKPLRFTYRLTLPNAARREGEKLILSPWLPTHAVQRFARLPSRSTAQWVAPPIDTELWLTVRLPDQAELATVRLPGSISRRGLGAARFSARWQRDGKVLQLRRVLRMPLMRIEAGRYLELATFCQQVDEAENRQAAVGVAP